MKIPKILMTAGALTAFSFSLAAQDLGQQEARQQDRPGTMQQDRPGAMQQDRPGSMQDRPGSMQDRPGSMQQDRAGLQQDRPDTERMEAHRVSDIKGSRVVNSEGERLGTVDDLAIQMEDGVFNYVIIAAGGFLGIGGDLRAVPPELLKTRDVTLGIEVILDITEERWEQAPKIERDRIHMLSQESRAQQIYEFYGLDWEARQQQITEFAAPARQRQHDVDSAERRDEPRDRQVGIGERSDQHEQIQQQLQQAMTRAGVDEQQAEQEARRLAQQFTQESPDQEEIERQVEQALTQAGVSQQEAQEQAEQLSGQIQRQIEFAAPQRNREMQQQRPGVQPGADPQAQDRTRERDSVDLTLDAELRPANEINVVGDLMNARIENAEGEELGKISDILVNLEDGRAVVALVSTATSFWEMTDEEYAVSTNAFEVRGERLILNLTQQELETAQLLTRGQLGTHLEEQAGRSSDEARQSPQVFRYDDTDTAPGAFGAPGRDRDRDQELDRDTDRDRHLERDRDTDGTREYGQDRDRPEATQRQDQSGETRQY